MMMIPSLLICSSHPLPTPLPTSLKTSQSSFTMNSSISPRWPSVEYVLNDNQSITSNWHEMSPSKLGPNTPQVPLTADVMHTSLPSTPSHHYDVTDFGTPGVSSTTASLENLSQSRHDRTSAGSSFYPSSPTDGSHGCEASMAGNDRTRTNLQPHEIVSYNNNNKQEKHIITTTYTQNTQGLWYCPRDLNGNILIDYPPDLS